MRLRLLLLGVILAALPASAQERADLRRVVLTDGSVVVGVVEDAEADPLVVIGENGVEQRIPRHRVAEVAALYDGRFTRLDPNRTRLFLTPNGRVLGRGAGRFSTYTLVPSVAYGLTDRVDVSVGAAIPAVGAGEFATAVNLNAKAQVLRLGAGGGVAVGGNVVVPILSSEIAPGLGGMFYAVATLGSETRAVTVGAGGFYGTNFEEAEIADGAGLVLGYEQQLSSSVKFITENVVIVSGGSAGVTTAGVRFFGDRLAADVAAVAVFAEGEFLVLPVPYVGLAYNFGR